jgi:hypothetical protein
MRYRVPRRLLERTFSVLRSCGQGRQECQALWISAWHSPYETLELVHPAHRANAMGFSLDSAWLNAFWLQLAESNKGVRVQIHTHPRDAFHSHVDDSFPIVHTRGFLSLVIPNFALGPVKFADTYLTEIAEDGRWNEVAVIDRFEIEDA